MEDFIRVWTNKVPEDLCATAIQTFETIIADTEYSNSVVDNTKQFNNSNLGRKDLCIFLGDPVYNQNELCNNLMSYLHSSLLEYVEEFGQFKEMSISNQWKIKLQRTLPTGGYHVWHCENDMDPENWCRELVWMIYLNDMPDGEAETEFLYQRKRVKPSCGTIVMWPAASTHMHRGNPVYTQPKYILTGWYHKTI